LIRIQEIKSGIFKFGIPSPKNNKYSTPLLSGCATKLPPSISKKYYSTQLNLRWRSDLTNGGEGYLSKMVDGRYRCSACICRAGHAETMLTANFRQPSYEFTFNVGIDLLF
jgi:hypothetical protein